MSRIIWSIVVGCAAFIKAEAVLAAESAGLNSHFTAAASPISASYAVQILFSFLAVIGFILLLAWLMRKTGRYGAGGDQALKVISSMSLGMREKILLIEVEGVAIVVGVAPGQVRTLHVFEEGANRKVRADVKHYGMNGVFSQLMAKFAKQ